MLPLNPKRDGPQFMFASYSHIIIALATSPDIQQPTTGNLQPMEVVSTRHCLSFSTKLPNSYRETVSSPPRAAAAATQICQLVADHDHRARCHHCRINPIWSDTRRSDTRVRDDAGRPKVGAFRARRKLLCASGNDERLLRPALPACEVTRCFGLILPCAFSPPEGQSLP